MMNNVAILANGDFPTAAEPLWVLRHAQKIICCDGAAQALLASGTVPYRIVGDMDSMPLQLQEQHKGIIVRVADQETNDLTKAFNYAVSLDPYPESITILGASGKREDHTLGNISLLADYALRAHCPVEMLTETGRFAAVRDTSTFRVRKGTQISIFCFDNTQKIKSAGLKYPTDNVVFDSLWKATLNEAAEDKVTLTLDHPSSVLVFFAYNI